SKVTATNCGTCATCSPAGGSFDHGTGAACAAAAPTIVIAIPRANPRRFMGGTLMSARGKSDGQSRECQRSDRKRRHGPAPPMGYSPHVAGRPAPLQGFQE